jgi:hypothetical protein
MTIPNQRERQFMQELQGSGWVKATAFPSNSKTIEGLLIKGRIEQQESGNDLCYRITDKGRAAKTAPVRV